MYFRAVVSLQPRLNLGVHTRTSANFIFSAPYLQTFVCTYVHLYMCVATRCRGVEGTEEWKAEEARLAKEFSAGAQGEQGTRLVSCCCFSHQLSKQ